MNDMTANDESSEPPALSADISDEVLERAATQVGYTGVYTLYCGGFTNKPGNC